MNAFFQYTTRRFRDDEDYRNEDGAGLDLTSTCDAYSYNVSRYRMSSDAYVGWYLSSLIVERVVILLRYGRRSKGGPYKANDKENRSRSRENVNFRDDRNVDGDFLGRVAARPLFLLYVRA